MKFSQRWWVVVALLLAFAVTVSFLSAQTEEPSAVDAPSSAEVQLSSDEPEQKQPALASTRDTAPAAAVETDRRFNELRRELLDDRAKMIDRWLEATAIFLTLLGVAAAILGYFGFKRLDRIESEARENMEASEKHAQEAQRYEEETQRDLEKVKEEARRYVEEIKTIRDKTEIDRAFSEAILLQQQNRIEEAIEKWRSIANITEGTDDERAAEAWFNIGFLTSPRNVKGENFAGAIAAYDKAIELNLSGPNLHWAYYNRGNAKTSLGQIEEAIADYGEALNLARSVGNADLMERARRNLDSLDRSDSL